jgi:RNA recognition motif-containing protein
MTIYVANLSHKASENDLNILFSNYGEVKSVRIIKDHETGKPRGIAFVEMADEDAGNEAIEALNEKQFMERTLVVNKARPKSNSGSSDRPRSGGGYNRNNNKGYNNRY